MKKAYLSLLFFSFTVFAQQNTVKDSFTYYKDHNQFIQALNYANKKASFYLTKKDYPNYIKQTNNQTAVLNENIKDHKRALTLLYKTLSIVEKKITDFEKVKIYSSLSTTYANLKLYNKAIEIAKKGFKIATIAKNDTVAIKLTERILKAYLNTQNTDSAFHYLEPTLKGAKKLKDNYKIADAYNNHFCFYSLIKEQDIAKKYLDTCIIFAEKAKVRSMINASKSNLGAYYLVEEKNYDKARDLYLEMIEENKNDSLSEDYATPHLNISLVYEKLGDYKTANYHITKYIEYTEYALNKKLDSEIESIRTKYEIEKAETTFNEKELLLQQKQLKNERLLYLFIALLLLAGILFYFFYQNLKLRQKNKLKDLNHNVQQNLVNATIDGQEEERKRLSGVLHDNISALLSSASLHLMAFEANHPEIDNELKKTKVIIKEAHDKVRDLSHDLIPPVLDKLGLLRAFEDLCEKNSNSLIAFNFNNFIEDNLRFQNEFEMKLYFIVVELFNNIIKHSNATEAFLTLDKIENQLSINIEDNGKGFVTNEGKPKEGLGLSQIKTRIKSMNGSMTINSKPENGTLIYIKVEIPE